MLDNNPDAKQRIQRDLTSHAVEMYYDNISLGEIYDILWPDLEAQKKGIKGGPIISAGLFDTPPVYNDTTPLNVLHEMMYEGQMNMQRELIGALRLHELPAGSNIVELGFGYGQKLIAMAKDYPQHNITGINISDEQIEYTKKRLEEENITNVRIIKADMSNLEGVIPAGSVSRVLSCEAMFHTKHEKTIPGVLRILDENGISVVSTVGEDGLTPDERAIFVGMGAIVDFINIDRISEILRSNGVKFEFDDLSPRVAETMRLTVKINEQEKHRFNPLMRAVMDMSWKRLNMFYDEKVKYTKLVIEK